MTKMSRGLRNNNPGNIRLGSVRYKGERTKSSDSAFRQFESMEWGYRAMFVLLNTYALKHNCRTLRSMINRYAPPIENHTEKYIRRVAYATHLSPDEAISTTDKGVMTAVVAAMSEVENGVKADMATIWRGWELFIADFCPK
jgi:hypothetical protein